jgi:hypothetical protein
MAAIARLLVALVLTGVAMMAGYLALAAREAPPETQWAFWLIYALIAASCVLGASKILRPRRLPGALRATYGGEGIGQSKQKSFDRV